jgi:hypothetical protein
MEGGGICMITRRSAVLPGSTVTVTGYTMQCFALEDCTHAVLCSAQCTVHGLQQMPHSTQGPPYQATCHKGSFA